MDGFHVAQRLKAQRKDQKTIIIALTGYGQERDIRRSVESGIDLHLTKPVEPQHLRELLGRIEQLQRILTAIPDIIAECRSLR